MRLLQCLTGGFIGCGMSVLGDLKSNVTTLDLHPRYDELVRMYGEPDIAPIQITSSALKDRLLEIHFRYESGVGETVVKTKKVPLNMTVSLFIFS
jgi:hypothetical protein